MKYITDRDGNYIVSEGANHHEVVVTIPDESPLFNPDKSWNKQMLWELAAWAEARALGQREK